jgi:hypothetical protein
MYDKPNKMIDMYGNNIYAYITYLTNNNIHIFPQLLTMAFSLMRCGSHADRICIVAADISDDYIILLQKFYIIYKIVDVVINGESYIKYYSLTMTQYKKVLLITPNFIILQNPDFLFTLRAPAANIKHNIINTDLLLLSPELNMFDSMIFDLKHNLVSLRQTEYIYNKYYSEHWTIIDDNYFYQNEQIINIDKIMYIYYKFNPVSIVLADINRDDIYITWFNIYKLMLGKYPDLITSPLLTETNRFLTSIMRTANLSRELSNSQTSAISETDIAGIKNMYNTGEIHKNLISYYHIDDTNDVMYTNDEIDVLFDNIEEFNFIQPIQQLNKIFKNPYLHHLSTYTTSDMKSLHIYNYMELNERDNIMTYYLKCFKNINIQILHGDIDKNKLKIDELKLNGLYYIKTLHLFKKEYENFLFMTFNNLNYQSRIQKIDSLNIKEEDNELTFIFYKDKVDNLNNTYMFSDLLLNQNNLHRLKHTDIRNIASPFFSKSNLYINTLKNWLYFNLSPIERERIILFGDIVLNSYGIKVINKIEGIYISLNEDSEREENIKDMIYNTFINKDSKFYFTHITYENTPDYNKHHKKIIDKIKQKTGITNTLDLITNSKYFSTYNGLKLLSVELNMCWIDLQSQLEKTTDIVMTNKINKNILSRFTSHKVNYSNNDLNRIKKNALKSYIKRYVNEIN